MAKYDDIGGVWRTIGGRRVFIKNGKDLATAMIESGKFTKKVEKIDEDGKIKYVSELRKKKEELKGKPDGTYDIQTMKPVNFGNEGYNVSFEQTTDNYTDVEYYGKVRECSERCDGKVYYGVFGGDPEISFYTKDKEEAIKIMKEYNQHSIWDNSINDVIENPDYDEKKNPTNYKD